MHYARRMSIVLFIVFMLGSTFVSSASAAPLGKTVVAQNTITHVPVKTGLQLKPLDMINECFRDDGTRAEPGEIKRTPTGFTQCSCFDIVTPDGPRTICRWDLFPKLVPRQTWINFNSGMYMDVENVSKNDGARIHQWTWTGANSQWWNMQESSNAYGFLRAINVNSNRCLGVSGGATTPGAAIIQWACNGNPDQSWAWTWNGLDYTSSGWPEYTIINLKSRMCLGISYGSIHIGAYAVQWPCNGSPDQVWF